MPRPVPVQSAAQSVVPRVRRGAAILLLAGLCAPCAIAAAPPAGDPRAGEPPAALTLGQAQRLAVERSRALDADSHAAAAAREKAVAAGRLPDPVLKFGVDNLPVNGPDQFSLTNDFMTMRRVGVMQEITGADKRRLRTERYELAAEKSLADRTAATAAIERDTALAWLDLHYARATADVIAEQRAHADLERQATEARYRGNDGSQADVFAARGMVAELDDRASEITLRVRNAQATLARWVGDAARLPLAGMPATDRIRLDPSRLAVQLEAHPQIAMLRVEEEQAATAARLAAAEKHPDWSVELSYAQRGPAYSNMVSVGVSVPIQWDRRHRQDRELAASLEKVEQAKAEREEMLRERVLEARTLIDAWHSDRERVDRYRRELIPLAANRSAAALAAYRGGKAGLAETLAAQHDEIGVRLAALRLEDQAARRWVQIDFLFPADAAIAPATMMPPEAK